MKHEWYTSIPGETHMLRAYEMPDESIYLVVMRTVFTNPDYPCALYHVGPGEDIYSLMELYGEWVTLGVIMRDMWLSHDLMGYENELPSPVEDLGTALYRIGEIIADGRICRSCAYTNGIRFGRTDIGTWIRLENERGD